jgi:outer membrane protein assembly factor BamE
MHYHTTRAILLALLVLVGLAACQLPTIPRVHKITVQQGNVITQDMINQLKPGMTRSQVAFIMGEPILRNAFNNGRWDYMYTFELPGQYNRDTRMSLYFENDVLAYFTGDLAPESKDAEPEQETAQEETTDAGDPTSES